MDASDTKAVALKIVVALGLGAVTYVVDPGTPSTEGAAKVYADNTSPQPSTPKEQGGGSGSGSGSSVWPTARIS